MIIVFSFVAALLSAWVLLLPFFAAEKTEDGKLDERKQAFAELEEKKERVLSALEDLEQDRLSKRVSEKDYEIAKAELSRDAATCISQLDKIQLDETLAEKIDKIKQDATN